MSTAGRMEDVDTERALLLCLLRTIVNIPSEEWTDSDKRYIQGNLKLAINQGSLTNGASITANNIISKLTGEEPYIETPECPVHSSLSVEVQTPSVSL